LTLDEIDRLDLGFDGADEIDPALNLVKGRGGARHHEKLVAHACDRYVIVAAAEKLVPQLGTRLPLPVEVIPFGWHLTVSRLDALGCRPNRRLVADGSPFLTDGGHVILDCSPGPIADAPALAATIKGLTGVVEHGLFIGLADQALIAHLDGDIEMLSRTR
jgi:ribose 5-phosphate isomerase A